MYVIYVTENYPQKIIEDIKNTFINYTVNAMLVFHLFQKSKDLYILQIALNNKNKILPKTLKNVFFANKNILQLHF